jgi:uncharacterized Zn finger protein (UPF0148 family)
MVYGNKTTKIQKKSLWYCCGAVLRSNYCPECGAAFPVEDAFNVFCANAVDKFATSLSRLRAAQSTSKKITKNTSPEELKHLILTSKGNLNSAIEQSQSAIGELEKAAGVINERLKNPN